MVASSNVYWINTIKTDCYQFLWISTYLIPSIKIPSLKGTLSVPENQSLVQTIWLPLGVLASTIFRGRLLLVLGRLWRFCKLSISEFHGRMSHEASPRFTKNYQKIALISRCFFLKMVGFPPKSSHLTRDFHNKNHPFFWDVFPTYFWKPCIWDHRTWSLHIAANSAAMLEPHCGHSGNFR